MAKPVSIIIPAFNQLDYCRQCVESVRANTEGAYRLILVDNGSTDGVGAYFDSVPGALVLHAEKNLGFAGGVNLGLRHADGHVLLLNSDTLTPRGWLRRMTAALESADDIGMVGPLSNRVSGSQQIDGLSFTAMTEIQAFADRLEQEKTGCLRDVARLVGFCTLIREEALRDVGLFDESYGIGNYEDDDYCLRVLRAGYRLCVAEDAFVFHYGGRTFEGMGIVDHAWRMLMADNERRFHAKWNVRDEERSDAAQVSRRFNQRANEAARQGGMAEAIRLFKCAIESYPAAAANYRDLGLLLQQAGEDAKGREYLARAERIACDAAKTEEKRRDALMRTSAGSDAMELTIREYCSDDEAEWMRVHAVILSISHAWNYSIQERPNYDGHSSTRLVAVAEGRIVGLTDAQYENTPGEFCFLKDSPGGYVFEFGRLPEYAGHNLGRRLIDATIEDARRQGFHRLEYWTQDRKAQRFYQRIGMREIGRHYRFRMKPSHDLADGMLRQAIGVEYLYCACTVEAWPSIRQQVEVIERHPLEPHLCIGYEVRF